MSMLVVTDEDFELEIARLNEPQAKIVPIEKMGRKEGSKETPESLRALIAGDALTSGATVKEVAEAYGVSQSSVNAYAGGATSTDRMVAGKLDTKLVERNAKIGKIAQSKLIKAMHHITEDKLKESKATDLAQIAANMSRVVEKTTPKESENKTVNNIIFYSPEQVGPGNYDVIDVTPVERTA